MGAGRVVHNKAGITAYDANGNVRIKIGVLDEMPYPTRLYVDGETQHWEATTADNWEIVVDLLRIYPGKNVYMFTPAIAEAVHTIKAIWRQVEGGHWIFVDEALIPKELRLYNMLLGD